MRLFYIAVAKQRNVFTAKPCRKLLCNEYRAMLPACAADSDSEIAAMITCKARQPALNEVANIARKISDLRVS